MRMAQKKVKERMRKKRNKERHEVNNGRGQEHESKDEKRQAI